MRNILITTDPFVNSFKIQEYHLRWLTNILTYPIYKATRLKPKSFISDSDINTFCRAAFFKISNIQIEKNQTYTYFNAKEINNDSITYLLKHIPLNTIIITFELSNPTRELFDKIGLFYIDIWQHPVRFFDDVLMSVFSNNKKIYDEVEKFDVPEEKYWLYANYVKTKIQINNDLNDIEKDSALFVGQTNHDKSLINNGKHLNIIDDYKKQFLELHDRKSKIYYSRHPLVTCGDEHILEFLSSLKKVEIGSWPAYKFLASDNIDEIVTISSSVAHEAKYFEKKIKMLFQPVFKLGNNYAEREYLSIYQDYISSHFWSKILKPVFETYDCESIKFYDTKDKIRDMLDWQYNYRSIDKLEEVRNKLVVMDRKYSILTSHEQFSKKDYQSIVVCGCGSSALNILKMAKDSNIEVVMFTDKDPNKVGNKIHGIPIKNLEDGLRKGVPCVISSKLYKHEIVKEIKLTAKKCSIKIPSLLASDLTEKLQDCVIK